MMHRTGVAIAALMLTLTPLGAYAAGANYDYVQVDYISSASKLTLDGDNTDTEADYDGFGLKLSNDFGGPVFGFGEMQIAETDDFEVGGSPVDDSAIDFNRYSLGLGIHNGDDTVDMYGGLSYERLSIESETGHGWGLRGGLRLTYGGPADSGLDRVEINPHVKYAHYGDIDGVQLGSGGSTSLSSIDGFEYGLRVLVYFMPNLALSADYAETSLSADFEGTTDDPDLDLESEVSVGLRYGF